MKRFAVMMLLVAVICTGCAGYTYNGIRGDHIRKATWGQRAEMVGGFAMAYVVHWASHVVYMEAIGCPWHQDGLYEIADGQLTFSEKQWFGRAGFVGANAVGWTAKLAGADSPFWRGYNMGVMFETATYPLFMTADLDMIDAGGGNGRLEWALYSISAIALNIGKGE